MNTRLGTVSEHIKELKTRLLWTIAALLAITILLFAKITPLFNFLLEQGTEVGYSFISLSPQEVITQEIRLSVALALFAVQPLALYQVWAYIEQPETIKRKLKTIAGILLILVLFLLGAIFAFKLMLPFMLDFLYKISGELKGVETTITIEKYLSFYISTLVVFGCITETPAVTAVMSKLGVVTPELLKKIRPFSVVAIFIVGAIVTPPDITSQLMVAIPMLAVYEVCIVTSKVFSMKEKRGGKTCVAEQNL